MRNMTCDAHRNATSIHEGDDTGDRPHGEASPKPLHNHRHSYPITITTCSKSPYHLSWQDFYSYPRTIHGILENISMTYA